MLSIDVGAKETSGERLHKYERHLIIPSEARPIFLKGPWIFIHSMSFRELFIS